MTMTQRLLSLANRCGVVVASFAAGLTMAAIAVLLTAGALGRYSGLYSLVWVEECSRALFIWTAFLGAALAVERGGHFRLTLLEDYLSERGRLIVIQIAHLSLAGLGLAMLSGGILLMLDAIGQQTISLHIPMAAIYAAVPLAGLLFMVFSATNLTKEG